MTRAEHADSALRVLVLGGTGMLGHKLYQVLRASFDVWATVRPSRGELSRIGVLDSSRVLEGIDAQTLDTMARVLDTARPDVVINGIGIVKQLPEAKDPTLSIEINALFPHKLAALCAERGIYLIQISTDCVFSGRRGGYTEEDAADAEDLYGRTKLLGEVGTPALTLRTSIIGRELRGRHGLLEWFLSQRKKTVSGYTQAVFSGLTTIALSELIAQLVVRAPRLEGLYHVSSAPISKYDLLCLLRDAYDVPVRIEPYPDVVLDRSLDSSRFRQETGFQPTDWLTMVQTLAEDPSEYEKWREERES